MIFFAEGCAATSGRGPRGGASSAGSRPPTRCIYEEIERRRASPSSRSAPTCSRCCSGARRGRGPDDRRRAPRRADDDARRRARDDGDRRWRGRSTCCCATRAVLARLRDELEGGDDAYLDAVVTETLRLRPVIDAAERTLKAPRTIAGWDLPAGIRVYPAIAVVHRRADLYPRAARVPARALPRRGAPSPTRGCRSAAGSGAASAPRSRRRRWPRCCGWCSRAWSSSRSARAPTRCVLDGITLAPKDGVPDAGDQAGDAVRRHPGRTAAAVAA